MVTIIRTWGEIVNGEKQNTPGEVREEYEDELSAAERSADDAQPDRGSEELL